jgi:glutamine amidotransferase
MSSVTIIDYDCGNLFSVSRAIELSGKSFELTSDPDKIAFADRLILPGVGAFGSACKALEDRGIIESIHSFVKTGKPFLGICLGMQLLFDSSEEFGSHLGLGLIPGKVTAIPSTRVDGLHRRIPNIGWCSLNKPRSNSWESTVLRNILPRSYMYFVHSYVGVPKDNGDVLAYAEYDGLEICAAVSRENVTGVQFHPEKSAADGLSLINNFVLEF